MGVRTGVPLPVINTPLTHRLLISAQVLTAPCSSSLETSFSSTHFWDHAAWLHPINTDSPQVNLRPFSHLPRLTLSLLFSLPSQFWLCSAAEG